MSKISMERFSARKDVPRYSRVVFETIFSPAVIFFALVGNVVLGTCVFLFHRFEADVNPNITSLLDSVWWGVTTVTTVGFGDVVPVTDYGRVTGIVLMIGGVVLFAGTAAIIASGFVAKLQEEIIESETLYHSEYQEIKAELALLRKELGLSRAADSDRELAASIADEQ